MEQLGFSVVSLCVGERETEVLQNKASVQKHDQVWFVVVCPLVARSLHNKNNTQHKNINLYCIKSIIIYTYMNVIAYIDSWMHLKLQLPQSTENKPVQNHVSWMPIIFILLFTDNTNTH